MRIIGAILSIVFIPFGLMTMLAGTKFVSRPDSEGAVFWGLFVGASFVLVGMRIAADVLRKPDSARHDRKGGGRSGHRAGGCRRKASSS